MPVPPPGVRAYDFDTQALREHRIVHAAPTLGELVPHVEDQKRRDLQLQHGLDEHELGLQPGRVDGQDQRVRRAEPLHPSLEDVSSDLLVQRAGREPVDAGEIDEVDDPPLGELHAPYVLLDGDARIVGHLLAEPGEPIEEGGLARVGRTDHRDERRVTGFAQDRGAGRGITLAVQIAQRRGGSLSSRPGTL